MEKTGSHPHPPGLNPGKGTMVRDMPADKKKPPSVMRTAAEWAQNPWAKAAQTKTLIERQVKAVTNGDLLGPRNAEVAVDRVIKSLDMLKGGARLDGLDAVLVPPPAKNGATPARTGPPKGARKLSDFFNTAALSFRDAASQRPVPQFRFRGSPPDARWSEGALNTDLLRATLREQLSNRNIYSAEDLAGQLHVTDLLLMSDHTLTPGALEFCEEIRNALADQVAQCGALQAGEGRLTDLLNAANHATSAYVLAKDVIAYAQARRADIGDAFAKVLAPGEAALLKTIESRADDIAKLPESTRGQLRAACHDLFGAEPAKQQFARIDEMRLSRAKEKLKASLQTVCANPSDMRSLQQATALARQIDQMKSDLPRALVKQATADIVAIAAQSQPVQALGHGLATALVTGGAAAVSEAMAPVQPLLTLLSSLPSANQEQVAKAFMAESLEQFSLDDLGMFKAALYPKPRALPLPPEGLTVFKQGLGGLLNACIELRKVTNHVASAARLLTTADPKDPKALQGALMKLAEVPAGTLNDSTVSQARRRAVQQEIEALKATLRSASDHLVAHFNAIEDIANTESIYQALIRLNVFMPPGGDGKAQRRADPGPASQAAVEALLDDSQRQFAQACAEQLQEAATVLREPFMPGHAAQVLEALDAAARADVISHRLQGLLGLPVDSGAWRAQRLSVAGVQAPALSDEAREAAQDLLSVLETVSKPVAPQASALGERLNALKTYLKGFGLTPTEALSDNRLRAAATTLKDVCGLRIAHGVPIDDSGLHRHMQSTFNEMLASAHAEMQGEGAASAVAGQAQRDLGRTTIRLERNGQVEALHEAVVAGGPAGGAAPSTITERLTRELGVSGLRFTSRFMTQEVLGAFVGEYLNANPDSPLRHQFGERAQADVRDAPTEVTIVPGEGSTTVRLSVRKDDCRDVKRDADVIDLDPKNSHIHMGFEMDIQNDGSGVALRKFTFDMRMTKLLETAHAAARLYVDSFRAIAAGPGANAEPALREAVRERALARLRAIEPPPADPRAHAKSVIAQEFRSIPLDRRLAHLEQALAVLPANDSVAPTDLLTLGVTDAIRQEYFATVHGIELAALGAKNAPNHTVNGIDIGIAEDLWKDFSRLNHYELRLPGVPTIAFAGAGDDTQNALSALKAMAVGLGPTEQAGREKLARIGKYAHQGIWPLLLRPHYCAASPLKLNGRPGGWVGPHMPARYLVEPLDDGAHRVTCTMRWRGTPDAALNFMYANGEMEELSSDSFAEGRIILRINEDGSAQVEEPPSVQCQFLPKPTTVLGRLDQAIRSINLPSL